MTKIYTINYENKKMVGGNEYYPDYPDDFDIVESSDWPPKLNENVLVKNNENNFPLRGVTLKNIWNDTATIVKLENQNYIEQSLKDDKNFNNGKGFFLLLPSYYWKYYTDEKSVPKEKKEVLNIQLNVEDKKQPNIEIHKDSKPNIQNLQAKSSINVASNRSENNNDLNIGIFSESKLLTLDDKHKLFENIDENKVMSVNLEREKAIPNNHENITKNPLYTPLLQNQRSDYFYEKEIDLILTNSKQVFRSLSSDKVAILNRKLKSFEKIKEEDVKIIINKNIALNSLIEEPADEINEGGKIINWVEKVLKNKVFTDLESKIHSGYVYLTRVGCATSDVITKKLVPNLNYFKWQENKPINYHTLKYVIFQSTYQKKLETNIIQKREAEDILSQEYIIALQPSPSYQLWTIKRLMMIWYGDDIFEKYIRKVKILINQYRADPTKDFNKKNGILPSILIYPKYGAESARIVLSKLEYYFSLYIDENSNPNFVDIQWNNSHPTYFVKKNAFVYYSNGSIELKNYINDSLEKNLSFRNDTFTKDYSELMDSKRIMSL